MMEEHVRIDISAIRKRIAKLAGDNCGQAVTEYVLLCALLACGVTAGYTGVAQEVDNVFNQVSATFAAALSVPSN
jgi:Flp pilus assembly pilin Flp